MYHAYKQRKHLPSDLGKGRQCCRQTLYHGNARGSGTQDGAANAPPFSPPPPSALPHQRALRLPHARATPPPCLEAGRQKAGGDKQRASVVAACADSKYVAGLWAYRAWRENRQAGMTAGGGALGQNMAENYLTLRHKPRRYAVLPPSRTLACLSLVYTRGSANLAAQRPRMLPPLRLLPPRRAPAFGSRLT